MLLLCELFIQSLLATVYILDAIAAFMKQCVVELTDASTIGYAGRSAIGPMFDVVNLQISGLCAAGKLAMLITVLNGT